MKHLSWHPDAEADKKKMDTSTQDEETKAEGDTMKPTEDGKKNDDKEEKKDENKEKKQKNKKSFWRFFLNSNHKLEMAMFFFTISFTNTVFTGFLAILVSFSAFFLWQN